MARARRPKSRASADAIAPAARSLDRVILTVRGERVILDADLARLYGVTTKRLNEQMRRNSRRFPEDFAFRLTPAEKAEGGRKLRPPSLEAHFALLTGHISSTEFIDYADAGSEGTRMPRTSWHIMARFSLVIPPLPLNALLTGRLAPVVAGIQASVRESHRLSPLRDALLPKLLFGDVRDRFRGAGYDVTVVLVFVDSPDVCIARIGERVAKGGHFVPDDDVRRRFHRSLRNFWTMYRHQADRWQLHYNGEGGTIEVARGEGEVMEVLAPPAFERFRRLLEESR